MSSFVLKIVAIITMLIDHSGDMIIKHLSIMNVIGRIAFPIFAFQLIVGYKNTSNIKNYIYRLLTFAIISQIPFSFMMYAMGQSILSLNIFFTLTMGVVSLLVYERVNNKFFKYFIIGILIIYQAIKIIIQNTMLLIGVSTRNEKIESEIIKNALGT